MKKIAEQITAIFQANGWQEMSLSEVMKKAGLSGTYICEYAVVGVVCADGVDNVADCWAHCQVCMSDLRDYKTVGTKKDLYLVFIISEIDSNRLSSLQSIVNDTYVCRKICIELKQHEAEGSLEEALEEALMDTPFLKDESQKGQLDTQISSDTAIAQNELPQELLNDLANRSASKVLDKLLAGEYQKGEYQKG